MDTRGLLGGEGPGAPLGRASRIRELRSAEKSGANWAAVVLSTHLHRSVDDDQDPGHRGAAIYPIGIPEDRTAHGPRGVPKPEKSSPQPWNQSP